MGSIKKISKHVGKLESLYTDGGIVNQFMHYGKQYEGSPKKIKIELRLGMYSKEMKTRFKEISVL